MGLREMTAEVMDAARTANGGYTRSQLEMIGVSWPPKRGWRKKSIGKKFPQDVIKRFASLGAGSRSATGKRKAKPAKVRKPSRNSSHPCFGFMANLVEIGDGLHLRFDGSCENNGSAAATGRWGFRLEFEGELVAKSSGKTVGKIITNNVSEWTALAEGLRAVLAFKRGWDSELTPLLIEGDSQLVINCLTGRYISRASHLTELRDECRNLLDEIYLPWHARWIPREENEHCDSLASPKLQAAAT